MCITTYINESEKNQPTGIKALDEELTAVRKRTGDDWQVVTVTRSVGFWRRKQVTLYGLLFDYAGTGIEYQIINFYRDGTDWSINTYVPAELIVAYLMGVQAHKPSVQHDRY
jgi:hypothetical protein